MSPSRRIGFLDSLVASLTVLAIIVFTLLIRREIRQPAMAASPIHVVRDWEAAAGRHRRGPANAEVSVVVFADFQCPSCSVLAAALDSVVRASRTRTAVSFRHLPLTDIHPVAFYAAMAGECAAAQSRFWALHDLLFQQQDSIGRVAWGEWARRAMIPDSALFMRCLDQKRVATRVDEDVNVARALGITVTPTLLINERLTVGVVSADSLRQLIREAANASARSRQPT